MDTCIRFYADSPTGLAPEIVEFGQHRSDREFGSKRRDQHSLLRPEAVESIFVMWRLTHDPKWRERGWEIFLALREHARLPEGGYASIESVEDVPVKHRDGPMESFWLGKPEPVVRSARRLPKSACSP